MNILEKLEYNQQNKPPKDSEPNKPSYTDFWLAIHDLIEEADASHETCDVIIDEKIRKDFILLPSVPVVSFRINPKGYHSQKCTLFLCYFDGQRMIVKDENEKKIDAVDLHNYLTNPDEWEKTNE